MYHCRIQQLETDRLVLRPFVPEDADPMFRNWANDPAVTKYLTWPTHQSVSVTHIVINKWIENYSKPNYYQWAIELKSLGEPIGSISGVNINKKENSVEIGYCIGQRWWGQGIVAEALDALMRFFFEKVGVDRIIACHLPDNPNSGKVMQKCGMCYEGRWYTEEKARELCWYSIDKKLYFNLKESI